MEHKIKVHLSRTPDPNGVVAVKKTKISNRLLNKLFGTTSKTILVLGDTVTGVSICDVENGGADNGKE